MKTVTYAGRIALDALRVEERPMPRPGPGEHLLRMHAASLNFRDLAIARDGYGGFRAPLVPLSDGVGEVVERGPGAERFALGTRLNPVYLPGWRSGEPTPETGARRLGGPDDGVLSEYVVVREDAAVAVPDHLTDAEAATLPIAGVTAWRVLFENARLRPAETVVVQGTGGVSLFAVALARAAGARVIALSSSDEKLARVRALGAHEVVNRRRTPAWEAAVLDLTSGAGADLVVDVAGGSGLDRSIAAARIGGTVALVGFVDGASVTLDLTAAIRRQVALRAVSGGSRASHEALARALSLHRFRPVIDATFPMTELPAALRHLERGGHLGKVVVSIP